MILLQRHIWAVARMAPGSLWLVAGEGPVDCGVPVVPEAAVEEVATAPAVDAGVLSVVVFVWAGVVGVDMVVAADGAGLNK